MEKAMIFPLYLSSKLGWIAFGLDLFEFQQ